jgi:hypothetical protein
LKYTLLWRHKYLTTNAKTVDDMVQGFSHWAQVLEDIRDSQTGQPQGGTEDDYARLATSDLTMAKTLGFEVDEEDEGETDELYDPNLEQEVGKCPLDFQVDILAACSETPNAIRLTRTDASTKSGTTHVRIRTFSMHRSSSGRLVLF